MNSIIKIISLIYDNFINFITICSDYVIKGGNFICSYNISINKFAQLLILIGSVILILGVLFKNPTEIINSSILSNSGPGMIAGIYYPDKIQEFIRIKNQVILGLSMMFCGYLIIFISSTEYNIFLAKWLLLTVILIYLLASLIAGYNRKDVIVNWKNNRCKYHLLITDFLDKNNLNNRLSQLLKSDQIHELNNTLITLNYIKDALSIQVDSVFINDKNPSLEEIEALQFLIKRDTDNLSLFYYLFKPKRLLKDFFVT